MEAPHALTAAEVLRHLGVRAEDGLRDTEAQARLERVGPNALATRRTAGWLQLLLHQFTGPVVWLLGGAAALALWFGEREDAAAILVVLALNALIGWVTERKAARAIEALRALGGHAARVRRDGAERSVPAETLVPGDIVVLDAGDAVPADVRVVTASRLSADESTLTGESVSVDKDTAPVAADARLGDRSPMLFRGSAVTRGSAVGVVVATGLHTQLGQVTQLVLQADAGRSPLERRLARLSAQLVWTTLLVAAAIAAIGLAGGRDLLLMLEAGVALAVAAIPEGLPIVATLALARGMWRMARRNALVERLAAVETLGATTVILTDKTGTLTENRMAVRRLLTTAGEVTPAPPAAPAGSAAADPSPDPAAAAAGGAPAAPNAGVGGAAAERDALLRLAALCNDAQLDSGASEGQGDPMEVALLRASREGALDPAALRREHPRLHTHAFDPALRMMATVHAEADGVLVAVKGAPEAVIAAATRVLGGEGETPLDPAARAAWSDHADRLARQGLRVLACARKRGVDPTSDPFGHLTLVGLIGLEDPLRPDVPDAIRACTRAGVRVVMVTGDHAVTARSIGHAAGLAVGEDEVVEGAAMTGVLAAGPAALRRVAIFARVSPAEKLALVKAYQEAGDVVAMTGDGVNDAPALRQADIGVAMGRRGTDVARQAAAMVLLDDAFPTIVMAIGQGRVIFENIRRFVAYLLGCNLSEVMVVGLAVATALPLPLLPLQILYLNLSTDVFPAFALALGEGGSDLLAQPPRPPKAPLLGRRDWFAIVLHGAAMTAGTFAALAAAEALSFGPRESVTVTFLTLAFAQLWHVFDMRGRQSGPIVNEVTRNPWIWAALGLCAILLAVPPYVPPVADLLRLTPLDATMWGIVLACSLAPFAVSQVVIAVLSRRGGRADGPRLESAPASCD
ncbi:MAG: ATPase [Rhodospirillales bacterium 69-11]|nr:MAG: ATPase [Rhodospirillales bacterium 69-11]